MSRPRRILLVEDNPADVRLMQEALKESGQRHELHTSIDGEDALDFLFRRGEHTGKPQPDLILLDINLPKINGHNVLQQVKNDPDLKHIPVLMLTSSDSVRDIQSAYDHHANAYLQKPTDINHYFQVVSEVKRYWTETVRLPGTEL